MNRYWPVAMLLGTFLVAPTSRLGAYEDMREGKDAAEFHRGPHEKFRGLDLSEDQKTKLKSIKESEMASMRPIRRKERDLAFKLKDQLEDKASEADLKKTLSEIKSTHESMQTEAKRFRGEREAVFTPTQQAKMVLWHMHHHRDGERGEGQEWHRHGPHEDRDDQSGEKANALDVF